MNPFVVDANVMNYFQIERVKGVSQAHAAIEAIFSISSIALDADGRCQQEWLDCAAGTFPLALSDWINDKLIEQKIQLYSLKNQPDYKTLMKLGIPKKDHKWVQLSVSSEAIALVTEDIDLIEPSKKSNSTAKQREEIKQNGRGSVAKSLRKDHGVTVLCCQHVPEICAELTPPPQPPSPTTAPNSAR
jgi:hypothetical protein